MFVSINFYLSLINYLQRLVKEMHRIRIPFIFIVA